MENNTFSNIVDSRESDTRHQTSNEARLGAQSSDQPEVLDLKNDEVMTLPELTGDFLQRTPSTPIALNQLSEAFLVDPQPNCTDANFCPLSPL